MWWLIACSTPYGKTIKNISLIPSFRRFTTAKFLLDTRRLVAGMGLPKHELKLLLGTCAIHLQL